MAATPERQQKLKKARQRIAALKAELEKRKGQLALMRRELEALRTFSLDVFPDHRVPPDLARKITALREDKLTFLAQEQLESLVSCVLETEAAGRDGILIEAGTASGGSAIAMALAKSPGRELHVHDVFGLIPAPGERDGADVHERYAAIVAGKGSERDDDYYGYRDDLLGEVTSSFARHGVPVEDNAVRLVQGLFEDTITGDEPVALAHVDGDWYASTMTCLERISPRLVPGGRLVIDDYYTWSGCRTAVDEYFAGRPGFRVEMRAKVHVVREG
ncbi:asparagine synthase (glutamine-hydrolyzing) [Nocardioides thalensis]|uniref:Asparagine synthase (Glutamine-hydrolyzing) n=1 Tax=Nocardioides thalensis TaxID=1914755 RepID=A0A853C375_9ACTN|nr:asparagine synthase (glutamine-hydrolyzing) [Nocardioides thalensis]